MAETVTGRINHSSPALQTQERSFCSGQAVVATAGVTGHWRTGWSRSNRFEGPSTDPYTCARGSNPRANPGSYCHTVSGTLCYQWILRGASHEPFKFYQTPWYSGTISPHAHILSRLRLAHTSATNPSPSESQQMCSQNRCVHAQRNMFLYRFTYSVKHRITCEHIRMWTNMCTYTDHTVTHSLKYMVTCRHLLT